MGLENQTNGWILMVNQADPTVHSKYIQTYTDINALNCAHLEPRSESQKGSMADAWHPKTMPCGANESHAKRVQSMNIYIYMETLNSGLHQVFLENKIKLFRPLFNSGLDILRLPHYSWGDLGEIYKFSAPVPTTGEVN